MTCFTADVLARSGIVATDGTRDPECAALCEALEQLPGVEVIAACSGHGVAPARVWFTAVQLAPLARVLVAYPGWRCEATASCPCCPVRLVLIAGEPLC